MAKDPAILWYWNDWNGGTSTFTRHLKGCYIDLLSSQFNSGRLSLAEIKTVLGADFGPCWTALQKKFRKDENEMYYNERMEQEQEKRKRFTESRRKNLESRKAPPHTGDHVAKSTGDHMEDVNENENVVGISVNGFFSDSLPKDVLLTESQIGGTIEYIRLVCKKILGIRDVVERWEAFKIKQFCLHEWYNSYEKLLGHFRDSLKFDYQKNGTDRTNHSTSSPKPANRKSAGAAELANKLQEKIRVAGSG